MWKFFRRYSENEPAASEQWTDLLEARCSRLEDQREKWRMSAFTEQTSLLQRLKRWWKRNSAVPLRADEQVSIMAFSQHEHPAGEARQEAAQKLREHFQDIDPRTEAVPTEEMEEVLNEALRSARPGYRERE